MAFRETLSGHVTGFGPSMFTRRLVLLACGAGLAMSVLVVQSIRLGTSSHDEALRISEERLIRTRLTSAVRGEILDRKGRVLATDRPSYAIALPYGVINGEWAEVQGARAARRAAGRRWLDLSPKERDELNGAFVAAMRVHLESAWNDLATRSGTSRSEIDASRDRIIQTVERRQNAITRARYDRDIMEIYNTGKVPTEDDRKRIQKRAAGAIAEKKATHVLLSGISDEAAFNCRIIEGDEVVLNVPAAVSAILGEEVSPPEPIDQIPGLSVRDRGDRDYPLSRMEVTLPRDSMPGPLRSEVAQKVVIDGLATHVIGRLRMNVYGEDQIARDAWIKDLEAKESPVALVARTDVGAEAGGRIGADRGSYRDGDSVGEAGIEGSQEHVLRGLRGVRTLRVDTGEASQVVATAGQSVKLTIDAMLQARIQAIMSPAFGLCVVQPWHHQDSTTQQPGDVLNGAAIVLDIDSGEILAMVSMPSYTLQELRDNPESLIGDSAGTRVSQAMVNRAISKPYQPGSVVKPLILAGAVARGNFTLDQTIECTGHLLPNRANLLRCWIFKRYQSTHNAQLGHSLHADEAIMVSCNIFFYTLGRRLGPEGIIDTYKKFGLMEPIDLGVDLEYAGTLGPGGDEFKTGLGDATQMGIGQGPVAWTPLHAADAYATIARGGIRVRPRLVAGTLRAESRDLGIDSATIDAALRGLSLAVNDGRGTGNSMVVDGVREPFFTIKGVKVWGKTGTAHASPIVGDPDGEGPSPGQILEQGDHSWFVLLAGADRPRYAISVVIDFGGSGGKVSGPICNQIVRALVDEGYLKPAAEPVLVPEVEHNEAAMALRTEVESAT